MLSAKSGLRGPSACRPDNDQSLLEAARKQRGSSADGRDNEKSLFEPTRKQRMTMLSAKSASLSSLLNVGFHLFFLPSQLLVPHCLR
jgi:hypothetical protein